MPDRGLPVNPSPRHLRRLHHRVKQHVCGLLGPIRRDLLGLVVAEAVHAGAHHHRGGIDAVDPAGVVARAAHDVAVGIAQPLRRDIVSEIGRAHV